MAADLILHAVDPFPGAERVISVATQFEPLLPVENRYPLDDDENTQRLRELWEESCEYRIEDTDEGTFMVEISEGHDEGFKELFEWMLDRRTYSRIDIGPFSTMKAGLYKDSKYLPGPIVSLAHYLDVGIPTLLTPAVAAGIMVALNVHDESYYRHGMGAHKIGNRKIGYYKAGRSKYLFVSTRRAKRQWVKAWLAEHMGSLVWLSTE